MLEYDKAKIVRHYHILQMNAYVVYGFDDDAFHSLIFFFFFYRLNIVNTYILYIKYIHIQVFIKFRICPYAQQTNQQNIVTISNYLFFFPPFSIYFILCRKPIQLFIMITNHTQAISLMVWSRFSLDLCLLCPNIQSTAEIMIIAADAISAVTRIKKNQCER